MTAPRTACEFIPPHEPWTCRVHQGIRTRLDEPQCDAIRPVKPFTAGQLDNLRKADAEGRVPANRYIVRGLLATLTEAAAGPRDERLRHPRDVMRDGPSEPTPLPPVPFSVGHDCSGPPDWNCSQCDEAAAGARDEAYGWHADGDLCRGPECLNIDETTGDHSTDVHSDEWWDGYTEHGRRAAAAAGPQDHEPSINNDPDVSLLTCSCGWQQDSDLEQWSKHVGHLRPGEAAAGPRDEGLREALDLLNSLGIAGPNIVHRIVTPEDYTDPESGIDLDPEVVEVTKDDDWCVCGRIWPCEAFRLYVAIERALTDTGAERGE